MKAEREATIATYKAAAEHFVRVVDSASGQSTPTFLVDVGASLPQLYSAALTIPAVAPQTSELDDVSWPNELRAALWNEMRKKLGQSDGYFTVFDSTSDQAAVQASLAEDICDIYFDVKSSLQRLQNDGPTNDVLWQLRFAFSSHWGRHLTSALKAIHDMGYGTERSSCD